MSKEDPTARFLAVNLGDALRGMSERSTMTLEVAKREIDSFLDRQDVEGLLAIRRLLKWNNNSWWDGQITAILRTGYNVDEWTGEPLRDIEEQFRDHLG